MLIKTIFHSPMPELYWEFDSFDIVSNKLKCFVIIHFIFCIVVIIGTSICVITKVSHSISRFKHHWDCALSILSAFSKPCDTDCNDVNTSTNFKNEHFMHDSETRVCPRNIDKDFKVFMQRYWRHARIVKNNLHQHEIERQLKPSQFQCVVCVF